MAHKSYLRCNMENPTEKLKGIGAELESEMSKVLNIVEQNAKELLEIANPVSRKDVTVDGKNIFLSLTKSNQVVFNFASADHAQEFYDREKFDDLESISIAINKQWAEEIVRLNSNIASLKKDKQCYVDYVTLPWYKRMFKTFGK